MRRCCPVSERTSSGYRHNTFALLIRSLSLTLKNRAEWDHFLRRFRHGLNQNFKKEAGSKHFLCVFRTFLWQTFIKAPKICFIFFLNQDCWAIFTLFFFFSQPWASILMGQSTAQPAPSTAGFVDVRTVCYHDNEGWWPNGLCKVNLEISFWIHVGRWRGRFRVPHCWPQVRAQHGEMAEEEK